MPPRPRTPADDDVRPFTVRTSRPRNALLRAVLKPSDPFPALPAGFTRVRLDHRLAPVTAGPDTLGRRYAALFRPWAVVDQREHLLDFRLPCASNDGATGMLVEVRVNVMITEPEVVVLRGAGGLRHYVQQDVGGRVGDALARPDGASPIGFTAPLAPLSTALERVASMHTVRRQVAYGLAETLRPGTHWGGLFYQVTVVGYSVAFDQITQGHHDRLVAAARDAEKRHLPTG